MLFGAFILACGATHALSLWTIWHPDYLLAGAVKQGQIALADGSAVPFEVVDQQRFDIPRFGEAWTERWQVPEGLVVDRVEREVDGAFVHLTERRARIYGAHQLAGLDQGCDGGQQVLVAGIGRPVHRGLDGVSDRDFAIEFTAAASICKTPTASCSGVE